MHYKIKFSFNAILIIAVLYLAIPSKAEERCLYCEKELSKMFLKCITGEIGKNPNFENSKPSLKQMKTDLKAANQMDMHAKTKENIIKGVLLIGCTKLMGTGENLHQKIEDIGNIIEGCYYYVGNSPDTEFIIDLKTAVEDIVKKENPELKQQPSDKLQSGQNDDLPPPDNAQQPAAVALITNTKTLPVTQEKNQWNNFGIDRQPPIQYNSSPQQQAIASNENINTFNQKQGFNQFNGSPTDKWQPSQYDVISQKDESFSADKSNNKYPSQDVNQRRYLPDKQTPGRQRYSQRPSLNQGNANAFPNSPMYNQQYPNQRNANPYQNSYQNFPLNKVQNQGYQQKTNNFNDGQNSQLYQNTFGYNPQNQNQNIDNGVRTKGYPANQYDYNSYAKADAFSYSYNNLQNTNRYYQRPYPTSYAPQQSPTEYFEPKRNYAYSSNNPTFSDIVPSIASSPFLNNNRNNDTAASPLPNSINKTDNDNDQSILNASNNSDTKLPPETPLEKITETNKKSEIPTSKNNPQTDNEQQNAPSAKYDKTAKALKFSETLFIVIYKDIVFTKCFHKYTTNKQILLFLPYWIHNSLLSCGYSRKISQEIAQRSISFMKTCPEGSDSTKYAEVICKTLMVLFSSKKLIGDDPDSQAKELGNAMLECLEKMKIPLAPQDNENKPLPDSTNNDNGLPNQKLPLLPNEDKQNSGNLNQTNLRMEQNKTFQEQNEPQTGVDKEQNTNSKIKDREPLNFNSDKNLNIDSNPYFRNTNDYDSPSPKGLQIQKQSNVYNNDGVNMKYSYGYNDGDNKDKYFVYNDDADIEKYNGDDDDYDGDDADRGYDDDGDDDDGGYDDDDDDDGAADDDGADGDYDDYDDDKNEEDDDTEDDCNDKNNDTNNNDDSNDRTYNVDNDDHIKKYPYAYYYGYNSKASDANSRRYLGLAPKKRNKQNGYDINDQYLKDKFTQQPNVPSKRNVNKDKNQAADFPGPNDNKLNSQYAQNYDKDDNGNFDNTPILGQQSNYLIDDDNKNSNLSDADQRNINAPFIDSPPEADDSPNPDLKKKAEDANNTDSNPDLKKNTKIAENAESKKRVTFFRKCALECIKKDGHFDFKKFAEAIAAVMKSIKEKHSDWGDKKIQATCYIEALYALTLELVKSYTKEPKNKIQESTQNIETLQSSSNDQQDDQNVQQNNQNPNVVSQTELTNKNSQSVIQDNRVNQFPVGYLAPSESIVNPYQNQRIQNRKQEDDLRNNQYQYHVIQNIPITQSEPADMNSNPQQTISNVPQAGAQNNNRNIGYQALRNNLNRFPQIGNNNVGNQIFRNNMNSFPPISKDNAVQDNNWNIINQPWPGNPNLVPQIRNDDSQKSLEHPGQINPNQRNEEQSVLSKILNSYARPPAFNANQNQYGDQTNFGNLQQRRVTNPGLIQNENQERWRDIQGVVLPRNQGFIGAQDNWTPTIPNSSTSQNFNQVNQPFLPQKGINTQNSMQNRNQGINGQPEYHQQNPNYLLPQGNRQNLVPSQFGQRNAG